MANTRDTKPRVVVPQAGDAASLDTTTATPSQREAPRLETRVMAAVTDSEYRGALVRYFGLDGSPAEQPPHEIERASRLLQELREAADAGDVDADLRTRIAQHTLRSRIAPEAIRSVLSASRRHRVPVVH